MSSRSRWLVVILTLPMFSALSVPALAAGEPIAEMNATDGAPNDNLAADVAISGTTAILGAPRDDVNGTQSGSAYLFDVTTGQQIAKLLPGDGAPFDSFGFAVSISGNVAIASAYKDDDNGGGSGSVSVFDASTGLQTGKLLAADGAPADSFGFAVDLGNGIAVIGAPGDSDLGVKAGSAYLFDINTGAQLFKLLASDGKAKDAFGNSVAIDGSTVIVGAPFGNNNGSGAAYLFDANTGLQLDRLTPNSNQAGAAFGRSVALDGNTALVGAPLAKFGSVSVGIAYVFDVAYGTQTDTLLADDRMGGDRFGQSVAIDNGQILVGAWNHASFGNGSGAAYVFDSSSGTQTSQLSSSHGQSGDRYGWSVDLSGDRAVLGAIAATGGAINSGSAFGIQLSGDIWSNLGQGLGGFAGTPSLLGVGDLTALSDLCLALGAAAANSPVFLVIGFSNLSAGFKGGVLVPAPDLVVGGFSSDGAGQLIIDSSWPAGTAAGVPLLLQCWVSDASAPQFFAASNAITKSTP